MEYFYIVLFGIIIGLIFVIVMVAICTKSDQINDRINKKFRDLDDDDLPRVGYASPNTFSWISTSTSTTVTTKKRTKKKFQRKPSYMKRKHNYVYLHEDYHVR